MVVTQRPIQVVERLQRGAPVAQRLGKTGVQVHCLSVIGDRPAVFSGGIESQTPVVECLRIVGNQIYSAGIVGNGFLNVSQVVVGPGPVEKCVGVFGVGPDGLGVGINGFRTSTQLVQRSPPVQMRVGKGWMKVDDPVKVSNRFFMPVEPGQDYTAVVVGLQIVPVQVRRLPIVGQGQFSLPQVVIGIAPLVPCLGYRRVQAQQKRELPDGVGWLPQPEIGQT